MIRNTIFVVVLVLACTLGTALAGTPVQNTTCWRVCKFTFCANGRPLRRGPFNIDRFFNDKPFTPAICHKERKFIVGTVDSTGEPLILLGRKAVPISSYKPKGLLQRFSKSIFKSYSLKHTKHSGVGHEVFQQNQIDFLDRKCIILPLTAYQVLDRHGNVVDNVHPRNAKLRDCVAFETKVGRI